MIVQFASGMAFSPFRRLSFLIPFHSQGGRVGLPVMISASLFGKVYLQKTAPGTFSKGPGASFSPNPNFFRAQAKLRAQLAWRLAFLK